MIEISNVSKIYKNETIALDNISLNIGKGVFGLLGRNGAGKTTLLRILTTILKPTNGEIKILGLDSNEKNYKKIKQHIGYIPQEFGFYKEFTVKEIMEYICILRDIEPKKSKAVIDTALINLNLKAQKNKKYKNLSGGMKRRLGLAQAMFEEPEILIVDEPTAGVDPQERINIREILSEYGKAHTVIFSTHIIEDIEHICSKLAILDFGKLIFWGDVETILNSGITLEEAYINMTREAI